MTTLQTRLKALENRSATANMPKRVYCLVGAGNEAQMQAFLEAEGWAFDPETDLIIHHVPLEPNYQGGVLLGQKAPDDPEASRLRFTHRPTQPDWRLEAAR